MLYQKATRNFSAQKDQVSTVKVGCEVRQTKRRKNEMKVVKGAKQRREQVERPVLISMCSLMILVEPTMPEFHSCSDVSKHW